LFQVGFVSAVRFTDCNIKIIAVPAINRWAIIIRPLSGLQAIVS